MICPICFKNHNSDFELSSLFNSPYHLCNQCFKQLDPMFIKDQIYDYDAISIYQYDGLIKDYLFRLKGQNDLALAPIFIERFAFFLSVRYFNYTMTYVPSTNQDNQKRGFNHVEAIFDLLKLDKLILFYKKYDYKQSAQASEDRHLINDVISLVEGVKIPKKILLVDDVITTGNSIKTCIKLLEAEGVKQIKVLIMSKVCR